MVTFNKKSITRNSNFTLFFYLAEVNNRDVDPDLFASINSDSRSGSRDQINASQLEGLKGALHFNINLGSKVSLG